jgi:hypothetical protein
MPSFFRRLAVCVLLPTLAGCNSSGCNPFAASPEKQAVRMIEKLGGQVVRDDKDPARPIVLVKLSDNRVTDEALRSLREKGFLHLLSSTVSFSSPVRTPSAWREFSGGRVPVVNPGLFIASQHPADFLGNSARPWRVGLQQPRQYLMELRRRQRRRFFSRRPFSRRRNHNASNDSVMW